MAGGFVTIAEAKKDVAGNIKFKVLSLGDLKSGTAKTGGSYQKQDAVIKDASGAMNLTLWNDDIGKLEPGKCYALSSAWWTLYKGEPQLALGKFYDLKPISEDELLAAPVRDAAQSTMDDNNKETLEYRGHLASATSAASIGDKLDAVLNELDIIKGMVEPLFKQMVDKQITQE